MSYYFLSRVFAVCDVVSFPVCEFEGEGGSPGWRVAFLGVWLRGSGSESFFPDRGFEGPTLTVAILAQDVLVPPLPPDTVSQSRS